MAPGIGEVAKCNTGATEPFFLSQSFPYFLRRALASLGFTIVRIGAERHGRVGVTGGGLNLLEVQTGLKERRDVGVPELVRAHRKVHTIYCGLPCARERGGGVAAAVPVWKNVNGGSGSFALREPGQIQR